MYFSKIKIKEMRIELLISLFMVKINEEMITFFLNIYVRAFLFLLYIVIYSFY
jgi:hypothetical protein